MPHYQAAAERKQVEQNWASTRSTIVFYTIYLALVLPLAWVDEEHLAFWILAEGGISAVAVVVDALIVGVDVRVIKFTLLALDYCRYLPNFIAIHFHFAGLVSTSSITQECSLMLGMVGGHRLLPCVLCLGFSKSWPFEARCRTG